MTKRIRTKVEFIEFFSMQTLTLYVMKEQTLIATWHNQGRRRLLKSGPAMKGQRCSRVPKARVGGEHERGYFPLS